MAVLTAILYLAAIVLLVLAAVGVNAHVSLVLLGAACALTAHALPAITTAI
jgi:hypothetical protein